MLRGFRCSKVAWGSVLVFFRSGLGSVGCGNEEWKGFVVGNGGLGISGGGVSSTWHMFTLVIGGVPGGGKCMGWYDILGSIP